MRTSGCVVVVQVVLAAFAAGCSGASNAVFDTSSGGPTSDGSAGVGDAMADAAGDGPTGDDRTTSDSTTSDGTTSDSGISDSTIISDGPTGDGPSGKDASGPGSDGSCATGSPVDYCSTIPALAAAPVIDGVLDCGPALVSMAPMGWNGPLQLPSGNSASIAAAWRPEGLYVFIQVVTPAVIPAAPGGPPFYGSAAEVFGGHAVDPDYARVPHPGRDPAGRSRAVALGAFLADENRRELCERSRPGALGLPVRHVHDADGAFVLEASSSSRGIWGCRRGRSRSGNAAIGLASTWRSTCRTPRRATAGGVDGHQRRGQYFLKIGQPPIGLPFTDPRSFCAPTLE